jgi:hypothetical protein
MEKGSVIINSISIQSIIIQSTTVQRYNNSTLILIHYSLKNRYTWKVSAPSAVNRPKQQTRICPLHGENVQIVFYIALITKCIDLMSQL